MVLDIPVQALDDATLSERLAAYHDAEKSKARADIEDYTARHAKASQHFTLANFRQDCAVKVCEIDGRPADLRAAISALLAGKSGLILGATRAGKSHLGIAIARECGRKAMRLKDFELATLYDVNRFRPSIEYKRAIERTHDCDLLIYDDIGKNACVHGPAITALGNLVFGIFDHRIEHGKQTIVTSRILDRKALSAQLGEDLLCRIEQRDNAGVSSVLIVF